MNRTHQTICNAVAYVALASAASLFGLGSAPSTAAGAEVTFEALVFNGSESFEHPDVFHFNQSADGRKHPQSRVGAQITMGKDAVLTNTITGETFPLKGGAAFFPACFSLMKTMGRGSVDSMTVFKEILGLNSSNPRQFVILTAGHWITVPEFIQQMSTAAASNKLEDFPFVTYARPQASAGLDQSFDLEKISAAMRTGLMEVHKIQSGIFIIGGQLPESTRDPVSGNYFSRALLPWNAYESVRGDFKVPDDGLVWELGKAGTDDPKLFPQLLPMAAHAAVKEALVYGVPLEKAFLMAHAPDLAHTRLYERYGFHNVSTNAKNPEDHRLLVLSLAEAIQSEKFKPRNYSEKVNTIATLSNRNLSDADVMRVLLLIRQLIHVELDYISPETPVYSPDARLVVHDRSDLFLPAARGLLEGYGIPSAKLETVSNILGKLNSVLRDEIAPQDVAFVPEQLIPNRQEVAFHVAIQDLSPNLLKKDHLYPRKALGGLYRWYAEQKRPFANFNDPYFLQQFKFTVFTNNEDLKSNLVALGGAAQSVKYAGVQLQLHGKEIKFGQDGMPAWAITFSAAQLKAMADTGATVTTGYWLRRNELRSVLVP